MALLAAIAGVLSGSALVASPAQASLLVQRASDCPAPQVSQPFTRWLDYASYMPVPGGSFEGGADGWSLSGASVVSGNESYHVRSASDGSSLALGSGGSAVSAPVCVGLEYPTMRAFARKTSGSLLSTLTIDVIYRDASGAQRTLPIGVITPSSSWEPSLPLPVVANMLTIGDGLTSVAFRFTAHGGSWQIDDVYVDPHMRR